MSAHLVMACSAIYDDKGQPSLRLEDVDIWSSQGWEQGRMFKDIIWSTLISCAGKHTSFHETKRQLVDELANPMHPFHWAHCWVDGSKESHDWKYKRALEHQSESEPSNGMRQAMCDTMVTAIEGGAITYWAKVKRWKYVEKPRPLASFELQVEDLPGWTIVTAESMHKAVLRIASGHTRVRDDIKKICQLVSLAPNDYAGDIDIEVADVLIQVAVLGEIVYG